MQKKTLLRLSARILAASMSAFWGTAVMAADHPVTNATDFVTAVGAAVSGDSITILAGDTVQLAGQTLGLNGVTIGMQAGSKLIGPATLNFSGNVSVGVITLTSGASSTASTTLQGLTLNDGSTSLYSDFVMIEGAGYATVSNNNITGGSNTYSIYLRGGSVRTEITSNTFSMCKYSLYAEGSDNSTLILTNNTFISCTGSLAIDYTYLPGNTASGSVISGNKFINPNNPTFDFANLNPSAPTTYRPAAGAKDFIIVANANSGAAPVIVNDVNGTPASGGKPGATYQGVKPPATTTVPTVSGGVLAMLGMMLAGLAAVALRRRA